MPQPPARGCWLSRCHPHSACQPPASQGHGQVKRGPEPLSPSHSGPSPTRSARPRMFLPGQRQMLGLEGPQAPWVLFSRLYRGQDLTPHGTPCSGSGPLHMSPLPLPDWSFWSHAAAEGSLGTELRRQTLRDWGSASPCRLAGRMRGAAGTQASPGEAPSCLVLTSACRVTLGTCLLPSGPQFLFSPPDRSNSRSQGPLWPRHG